MSEYKDKTPEQITDEDYKVAPTSSDKEKIDAIANRQKTTRQTAEEKKDKGMTKADQAEAQSKDIAVERSIMDWASRQATCNECGLTARNTQELQDHVRYAHKSTQLR